MDEEKHEEDKINSDETVLKYYCNDYFIQWYMQSILYLNADTDINLLYRITTIRYRKTLLN